MSRSYQIDVKECVDRVIKGEDKVSTQLEILEVLPCEEMANLLEEELKKKGFEKEGDKMVRHENGVTIIVDPNKAEVTVSTESSEEVSVEVKRTGRAYDDAGPGSKKVREGLKKSAKEGAEVKIEEKTKDLQSKVSDKLENALGDIKEELDQVVNRVTADALKRKASRMGQIKEMTEDPQNGSLTIVVEV